MCDCIEEINKNLKEKTENTELDIPMIWNLKGIKTQQRVIIATRKRVAKIRKTPIKLFATYCPFCGKPYEEAK